MSQFCCVETLILVFVSACVAASWSSVWCDRANWCTEGGLLSFVWLVHG